MAVDNTDFCYFLSEDQASLCNLKYNRYAFASDSWDAVSTSLTNAGSHTGLSTDYQFFTDTLKAMWISLGGEDLVKSIVP